mmetsp:Transcript_51049/g.143684  ORF Transcript_51049/g.143684 Transcript_51049/m.143684 type:complete len:306 (-) Transcript_51049:63-980(-)
MGPVSREEPLDVDEDEVEAVDSEANEGNAPQSFVDILGPGCVIKRMDKDRKIVGTAAPEEMQEELMTRASTQKRLGACAEHVKGLSRMEKLRWALDLKDRANEFFYASKFAEAAKLYNDCLVALDFEGTAEENAEVGAKLQLPVCTNLGACMIEMGQYERCIEICDLALAVDRQSPRALYRRGLAQYRLGNHVGARPDFEAALSGARLLQAQGTCGECESRSLADVERRVVLYLAHIRRFGEKEKVACQRMFERPLYADRPSAQEAAEEPAIDDSDEAIEAALAKVRGQWRCCICRRRAAKEKVP